MMMMKNQSAKHAKKNARNVKKRNAKNQVMMMKKSGCNKPQARLRGVHGYEVLAISCFLS